MEQRAEAESRFAEKNREQSTDCGQTRKHDQTFRQAGQTGAKPKQGEPKPAEFLVLVSADQAVNRAANKEREDRARPDDSTEQKRAARTQQNEPGSESAPVTGESFANEESERYQPDHRECIRQPCRGRIHAENFAGR